MNAYAIAYDNIRTERDKALKKAEEIQSKHLELIAACQRLAVELQDVPLPTESQEALQVVLKMVGKRS
jgi:hypothetical protein